MSVDFETLDERCSRIRFIRNILYKEVRAWFFSEQKIIRMNVLKIIIATIMMVASISAAGLRPGHAEGYLMLTRSDYFQAQLLKKLAISDRTTLQQRIKNIKLRAALKNILSSRASSVRSGSGKSSKQKTANIRMNRFKSFHH